MDEIKQVRNGNSLVFGVGINDADYVVCKKEHLGYDANGKRQQRHVYDCPYYLTWQHMLRRGYCNKFKERGPTYRDVSVCAEWLIFSKFRSWMENQDWEGKELDKDILIPGNRVYSPEACCFVSRNVNVFITSRAASRGEFPIGVNWYKTTRKFRSQIMDNGRKRSLGYFLTVGEAFWAWLTAKRELSHQVANSETDSRVKPALISYYENYPIPDFGVYPTRGEMIARNIVDSVALAV